VIVGAAGLTSSVGELLGLALVVILLGAAVRIVCIPLVGVWRALGRPGQVVLVAVGGLVALSWLMGVLAPAPPRRPRGPATVTVALRPTEGHR